MIFVAAESGGIRLQMETPRFAPESIDFQTQMRTPPQRALAPVVRLIVNNILRALCAIMLFDLLNPEQAHAYIDPGLGSMLLQGLAAGVISMLVFWRSLRHRIVSFFKKNDPEEKDADS